MHRIRLSLILSLAITTLASVSGAVEKAEARDIVEEHFIMSLGERSLGEERFTVEERGDTLVLEGRLRIELPAPREMTTRTVLLGAEDRLLDYVLVTESGDRVGVEAVGDSLRLWVTSAQGGRDVTAPPGEAKDLVLDNAVPSHAWLLVRHFLRDPEGLRRIRAFVPQPLWHGELERRAPERVEASMDGEAVAVTRHRFTIAGQLSEMDIDDSGRLMLMRVPIQGFAILRPGYDPSPPAPEAVAAAHVLEEITVEGGGPPLGGLLTLPDSGDGPWPACVLLHGSGPADRDMTVGPNRIFVQLAEGLAARGVATLRYDKRTLVIGRQIREGASAAGADEIEMDLEREVIDDALAAVALLRADPRIDPERIHLLGLSLGAGATATVARRLSERDEPVAGLLMMAPPGRDLLTILLDQYAFLGEQGLMPASELESARADAERLRRGQVPTEEIVLHARPGYWNSMLEWRPWRDYLDQPAPALILFGERDYQITKPDRDVWRLTLETDRRRGSEMRVLPGRNHLFLKGEGTPGPAEYGIPGEMGDEVLDLLGDWIGAGDGS